MKKIILLTIIWSQITFAIGNQTLDKSSKPQLPIIVRVYFDDPKQIAAIDAFADIWDVNKDQKFATIQITDESTYQNIIKSGLTMRLDTQLMDRYQAVEEKSNKAINGSGIPGFSCYSTVEETFARMDQMVANYPELADIEDIGDSWEKTMNNANGHDIRILKLTNQNIIADKPILFMASAIHAREYTTAELNTRFAEYMLSHYGTDADVTWILDNHEIHLSLQTNPDGREKAETGLLWRKNTNQAYCSPTSNSRGADLNRNYPFEWLYDSNECGETFRGASPESEPEINAQMAYIRNHFDDNRGAGINDAVPDDTDGIFVDIHSYSQLVLYPWGHTTNPSPNDQQFKALAKRAAYFNNYTPEQSSDLYTTFGDSIETTYGELGIASLVFELGTEFFQDCDVFESTIFPDNLNALIYLARITQAPYKQPLGPDVENFTIIPNVIAADTPVEISGVANDNLYSSINGSISTESVTGVTAYINELPISSINGQSLNAADGAFNEVQEAFVGNVDTNGLTTGKHLVYLQASDAIRGGGTYAKFIEVVEPSEVAQLSGQVLDASTGLPVEGALLTINQSQTYSINDGSFNQMVHPGTHDLTVTADNYGPKIIPAIDLTAGNTSIQDILMSPFCSIFNDDVENGNPGWTHDTPWAISTNHSSSPTHGWTDSPNGSYANNLNISLTSPAIDVSDTSSVEVSYMSYCDTEAGYDYGYFEVQFDNGSWQEVKRCDNQANWLAESHQINVPVNASSLKLRFRLDTDVSVTRDGWSIDDINVQGSGAVCGTFDFDLIFKDNFE
ncbi:MAG: M14 family zinc carboxypeptidase [Marinicella sp.]